jgi:hypothetical protein
MLELRKTAMNQEKNPNAEIYARMALDQIPRILTLQDRNPLSETYGSFSRTYWLDRTTDFSNALSQYATHALALSWGLDLSGNPFYKQPKILDWVFAGMDHWVSCQKDDGSFDEFYPQERGWAGPTGFLVYAMADSYRRLKNEIPAGLATRLLEAIRKGGENLGSREEIGTLANHYVMAALGVAAAHQVTGDDSLLPGYEWVLKKTLALFDDEGWGREYDGADIGYLSASVSFFSKIQAIAPDERIANAIDKAIPFSAYFVYPDGHFAGTLGSRNTLHFYPHGYELLADKNPLAARIADAMIDGLAGGALVPPHIMADRYFLYRVPEFLLSYIDSRARPVSKATLPYEGHDFDQWFANGRFFVSKKNDHYCVVNAGKGGVVKCFDIKAGRLTYADTGIMVKRKGSVASSQWVDPNYAVTPTKTGVTVQGQMHRVPNKLFTPIKTVLFRLFLIGFAWNTTIAYRLKGWIRRLLMLVHKPEPIRFKRTIDFGEDALTVTDELSCAPGLPIERALFADDIPVRYVPQSRYFQPQELLAKGFWASKPQIDALKKGKLIHTRCVDLTSGATQVTATDPKGKALA